MFDLPHGLTIGICLIIWLHLYIQIAIAKNEDCLLVGDGGENYWKIQTPAGQNGSAPCVIFKFVPPSPNNVNRAQSLKEKYDSLVIDLNACLQRVDLLTKASKFQMKCQSILSWDVDEVRSLCATWTKALAGVSTSSSRQCCPRNGFALKFQNDTWACGWWLSLQHSRGEQTAPYCGPCWHFVRPAGQPYVHR